MGSYFGIALAVGFGFFALLWLFVSVRGVYRRFRRRRRARHLYRAIDSGDLDKALRLFLDSNLWEVSVAHRQQGGVNDLSQWEDLVQRLCAMDPRISKIDQETGYTTEMARQMEGLLFGTDEGSGVLRVWTHFREACEHLYVRSFCDLESHSDRLLEQCRQHRAGRAILAELGFLLEDHGFKLIAAKLQGWPPACLGSFVLFAREEIRILADCNFPLYVWLTAEEGRRLGIDQAIADLDGEGGATDPPDPWKILGPGQRDGEQLREYGAILRERLEEFIVLLKG